jgi:solute carrier family 13 (sodium-dependent dicarboxylate transporter), member 2/3/5
MRTCLLLFPGPLMLGVCVFGGPAFDLSSEASAMAGIVFWMAFWWLQGTVPLAATALLPLVLFPLFNISDLKATSQAYAQPFVFLFIGGFLIAGAMERWNLHRRFALAIILRIGLRPERLLLGMMLSGAFLSMWISNTATALMLLPVALAVIKHLESESDPAALKGLSVALMLGLAYACSIGGVSTLVGSPTNLIGVALYTEFFPDEPPITFADWFFFAFPVAVCILATTWGLLIWLTKLNRLKLDISPEQLTHEQTRLGPLSCEERCVLLVAVSTAGLWLFRQNISIGDWLIPGWSALWAPLERIDDTIIAVGMALILFIIPRRSEPGFLLERDAFTRLPWGVVLLFGGGFALANGFSQSGLAASIASFLAAGATLTPLLLLLLICLGISFMTEISSNVATVSLVLPLLGALIQTTGANAVFIIIPAIMATSFAFMMPVATPPNAIVFASDRVRIREMMRIGIFVNLAAVGILTFFAYLLL